MLQVVKLYCIYFSTFLILYAYMSMTRVILLNVIYVYCYESKS